MTNKRPIVFRIICLDPPQGDDNADRFGLQSKSGFLLRGEPSSDIDNALVFTCQATRIIEGERCDFLGDYIHGKKGERFLYLSYAHANNNTWISRSKVMLTHMPAVVDEGSALETIVRATVPRATFVESWQQSEGSA